MRRIGRATVVTVAAAVMAPVIACAEPMVLTATQMESITAAARPPLPKISVVVNTNITTQIANAFALSFAIGRGASASSFALASNSNATAQIIQR
jgi:hypothetical protein